YSNTSKHCCPTQQLAYKGHADSRKRLPRQETHRPQAAHSHYRKAAPSKFSRADITSDRESSPELTERTQRWTRVPEEAGFRCYPRNPHRSLRANLSARCRKNAGRRGKTPAQVLRPQVS